MSNQHVLIKFCPHTIYPACSMLLCLRSVAAKWYFHLLLCSFWLRRRFSSPEQEESAGRRGWGQGVFRAQNGGRQLQCSVWVARETRQGDYLSPCTLNCLHFPGKTPDFSKRKLHCPLSLAVLGASLEFRNGHHAGSQ